MSDRKKIVVEAELDATGNGITYLYIGDIYLTYIIKPVSIDLDDLAPENFVDCNKYDALENETSTVGEAKVVEDYPTVRYGEVDEALRLKDKGFSDEVIIEIIKLAKN